MSDLKKCTNNNNYYRYCDEKPQCCGDQSCSPIKNNCKPECCNGLPKVVPDLREVKSVPILTNRIFDCMKLESPHFAIKNATFTITSTPPNGATYTDGDKICIDKICLKYDIIAATITSVADPTLNGTITACSQTVAPQAISGSIIPPIAPYTDTLSNNFLFNISNTKHCYENNSVTSGKQCRLIEQNLSFGIRGFKLIVYGRAGCLPFTAEYPATPNSNLNALLGLPTQYNFFGKMCLPQSVSGVAIKEIFEPILSIECVDSSNSEVIEPSGAQTSYTFNADIESTFLITKNIFAIIEDKLSVLTVDTPKEQSCHGSMVDINCPSNYNFNR